MASDDDEGEGTKGNRKRVPIWSIVKNASFVITAGFFILLIVLSLDAYKFISVRQGKYARKKLLTALQYMDPSIIEAHTGMKVLTKEEYANITSTLETGRLNVRNANREERAKYSELIKVQHDIKQMQTETADLTKIIAEKKAKAPPAVAVAAAPAELSVEELQKMLAEKTAGAGAGADAVADAAAVPAADAAAVPAAA